MLRRYVIVLDSNVPESSSPWVALAIWRMNTTQLLVNCSLIVSLKLARKAKSELRSMAVVFDGRGSSIVVFANLGRLTDQEEYDGMVD